MWIAYFDPLATLSPRTSSTGSTETPNLLVSSSASSDVTAVASAFVLSSLALNSRGSRTPAIGLPIAKTTPGSW